MEHLYPWVTIVSGATLVLLGSFLLAAERELKNKRRELDEFKRGQTAKPVHPFAAGQRAETRSSPELASKNDDLQQRISVLSSRLEESQRTLEECQSDQRLLLSAQSENQQLQEKVDNLTMRLKTSEDELATSTRRIHEGFDLTTKLQIEMAGLTQQLAEKDEAIVVLQSRTLEAAKMQSDSQNIRGENQRLLEEVTRLQDQLRTHEERLNTASAERDVIAERHAQLEFSYSESRQQTDELTTKNKQLQEDIDTISGKFAAAEESLQEFRRVQNNARLDNQQLLEANQQLKREIEMMHEELETLQSQVQRRAQEEEENHRSELEARGNQLQELSERCARLEAEAIDYRRQLQHGQWSAPKSETAEEQRADIESRETSYQEQQQKLEALIADLERELSEGKSQVEALEETHERLRETERICQDLGDENRRLEEEIARWQERLAASEENQRQVSMLRQQLDALQAERERASDKNRQAHDDPAAAEALEVSQPVDSASDGAMTIQSEIETAAGLSPGLPGSGEATGPLFGSSDPAPGSLAAKGVKASQIVWSMIARNWHFGAVFGGVVILVIAGAVAMKILTSELSISTDPVVLAPKAAPVEHVAEPVAKPPIKAMPRLRGAFQTVRPTQIFSGPSENSALIANIGPGMRLNVVDSKDGWLEVRSKHGRPPGFIRQEAAVRVGSN